MAPTLPLPSFRPTDSDDGLPSVSASAIVAGTASGYHVLRVQGYSLTKSALPNGKHIQSRPFRVAGRTWAIRYFPNGNRQENADYISLFLVLNDLAADAVVARFEFSFLDQVEKQQRPYIANSTAHIFLGKREALEKSGRVDDDCFTVRCNVLVARELSTEDAAVVPADAPPFVVVPPPDSPQHFRALLLGGKGADVRFLVGSEVFPAHRCVLAARSPVFDALLFGPMKQGAAAATGTDSCVRIDGMLPQVFQSLLHFVYTDSLPEAEGQDDVEAAAAATTMAQHLLEAADRYDLQRLKLICEGRLCQHIDVSTVATTLALAEEHCCQGLKQACFAFLKSPKTLEEAMATDGFQDLHCWRKAY
ncbi:BTB/POZ and MATH domain-containing protein 2-like [Panicum virgatum]|uniref:BTB/POZ and MATH domain-containing protein 2-like n=1 Tax=Panicum virgatum TaxID=38727 RepID=UPI0019D4FFBA|nr:BTB/POZ and MATH domain-containing protein 2-like [Panicum virgatum]